jgi:signal transduction histidine kinase
LERERNNKLLSAQAIAASIAHEVRQPLTAIAVNAGVALRYLKKASPDNEQIQQSLNRVISQSHRTSEVLDSIRAMFGRSDQKRETVDLNEIVRDVLQTIDGQLADNGIATFPELAALPLVDCYRTQLQQVIFNLAHNAIEAMQTVMDRKRVLRVRTECRGGSAVAVVVEDSGPGINPSQVDSIFSAFVTTKSHGMGLGLAICRQIVEQHGGQLVASSDGMSGAQFQVVLPVGSGKSTFPTP